MSWNNRTDWPRQAREAIAGLDSRSIPLPDNVRAAVDVLDRIEANKPVTPDPAEVRRAIVDGVSPEQITALLVADAVHAKLIVEWSQARIDAAGAVLAAVLNAAETIFPALAKLAEAAIGRLVDIAALDGAKLDDLVRQGRTTDAELVANLDVTAAELDGHYRFRDSYLTRGGPLRLTVNNVNASRWRDPVLAHHHASGRTPAEQYLRGIRAECGLWFPAPAEALEVAQEIANRQAADTARVKSEQHGVGSVAAW